MLEYLVSLYITNPFQLKLPNGLIHLYTEILLGQSAVIQISVSLLDPKI